MGNSNAWRKYDIPASGKRAAQVDVDDIKESAEEGESARLNILFAVEKIRESLVPMRAVCSEDSLVAVVQLDAVAKKFGQTEK